MIIMYVDGKWLKTSYQWIKNARPTVEIAPDK